MLNISFIACIKGYIGHKSLEDQTLSWQNGCLIPSHFVTQPPNLGLWISRSKPCLSFYFGQNVTRTRSHVFLVDCNQDPKPCNFQFFNYVIFYSVNERMLFSHVVLRFFFFFFNFFIIYIYIYKISGDSTPLTQKERCLKKHSKISLFFERQFPGLSQ